MSARDTGKHWENAALSHLQKAGLELIERNFHCRFGEIDLILAERDAIVFVEVRYRGDSARGDGAATVGSAKQTKLVRAAQLWLQARPQFAARPCRFDVIGCAGAAQQPQFDWVRNAFEAFTD
jgi:putative endonuclease